MSERHRTQPDQAQLLDDGDVFDALEALEVNDSSLVTLDPNDSAIVVIEPSDDAIEAIDSIESIDSIDSIDAIDSIDIDTGTGERSLQAESDAMAALEGLVTSAGQPLPRPSDTSIEVIDAAPEDPLALFGDDEVDARPASRQIDDDERYRREVAALGPTLPSRAALLEAYRARVAVDLRGDIPGAVALADRAAKLAPDARAVLMTRRWIAGSLRSPGATIAAARAELPLAGDATERLALLWQIATVETLGAAELTLRQILELDPQDLGAWIALASSTMQRKNWAAAAGAWDALAQRTDDPAARASFHGSAAGLRDAHLKDYDGARRSHERALEADPTSPTAHLGQQALLLRTGAAGELARLVAVEAQQVGDLDPALGYWECAGDLLWEYARDAAAAARSYEHAAALAQADVVQLGKLASLYEQEGRHAQLADVYEHVLERLNDPQRRGAVLHRLATLYETRLERPADAVRCYKAALDAVPTLAPAAQALALQYRAQRKFEEAASVLLVEVDRLGDGVVRAARYVSVAELLEGQVGASPQVTSLLERALALDPAQTAALDALDRIYRAEGRWDNIISLHEAQLAHTTNELRARALRLALANLYLDRGGQPQKAAEHLRATLVGPPDRFFVLAQLARALGEAGKWPEHVAVLEQQADLIGDGPEMVATLYRIATVVESRLGDPSRALDAYIRVLELNPRHELALHALLRLHRSQSRWEDVIECERRLLELVERPEEAAVIQHRIALLAEDHLGHIDDAIDAYEGALRNLPSYRPARVSLERLLRATGRFDRLATLLEDHANGAPPPDRARLFAQAAMLRELHVPDEAAEAAELYERALSVDGALPSALWGLYRIRTASEDWKGAAAALASLVRQTRVPAMRSRLLVQLARIHELRLGDNGRATELLGVALSADATPASVFERLRLALGAPTSDAPRWLMEAASTTRDENIASGLLRVRASLVEQLPAEGEPNRAAAAEAYGKALAVAATPAVVEGLARSSRGAVLAATLQQRARLIKDQATKTLLHTVAGALYLNAGAKHAAAADGAFRDALTARNDFLPALAGRRALAEAAQDWQAAADLCAEQAQAAMDPTNKVELFELAGTMCVERLGDNDRAIAHFREALSVEPGRRETLDRTLDLLEASGAWKDAATLIANQASSVKDERGRADLLGRRARLRADRLGDPEGAIADIRDALQLRPNDTALLVLLAQLHETRAHWADAARVYEIIARSPKPKNRRKALVAQARIWLKEVPDYPRAQRLLEAAREIEPDDRKVLVDLADVATKLGDMPRAAQLFDQLAHLGKPRERVTAMLAAYEVRRRLGEQDTESMQMAFELAFDDSAIVPMLEAHYRQENNLAGFAAAAENALTRAPSSERAETLRVAVGRIFAREANVPERAAPYLRAAVAASPDDPQLRMALATATRDDKAALAELRKAVELDPLDAAPYRKLAVTCKRLNMDIIANLAASTAAVLGDDDAAAQGHTVVPALERMGANSLLAEEAFALSVGQTRVADLRRLVAMLDPYLHEIFPDNERQLAVAVPLPEKHAIGTTIRGLAAAFGIATLPIYLRDRGEPAVLATEARAFIVSRDHVSEEVAARIRFSAGGQLARTAGGALLSLAGPVAEVRALFTALNENADGEGVPEMRKRVSSALPRRVRKDLERAYAELRIDANMVQTWEREEQSRATRIGLVACADLRGAARVLCPTGMSARTAEERKARIRATQQMVDAIHFAMSDACWTAIRRLYSRS
ncbi:MAG: tetratricopeptide repeat protein [Deltaproteobacteria bacterium]|nr:tetratricopeptide repeat protein [Deltaproteobacteria bacterium]